LQKFDWIDLNFGCPAPKVFKGEAGSALLAHPQKISKIINACVLNTQKPVSAKIRIGLNQNNINAVEIAKVCEEAGASAIIVHGRTREQGYGGQVQLEHIAAVKASVKVPVIGNGDVRDEQSYKQMLQTGVDGVSLARAALGKPWIFDVIKGKKPQVDEFEILKQHVKYLRKLYPENFLAKYLRKHFLWYLSSSAPAKLRAQIVGMENVEKVLQAMRGFVKKS
jgi:nifR3 family TIM-barrel protein